MKEIKLKIGDKSYKVKVAQTTEEQENGLQGVTDLPKDEGMLFVFDEPQEISMWMKDTLIPLDIIFIDPETTVISSYTGTPGSENLMTEQNVAFVLEVNVNSGIMKGDEIEFSPNSKVKSDKMIVLNDDGTPQMELAGGERIFSRPNTKSLIKSAKKAASTQRDNDYKALAKKVFEFLLAQDKNEPEFVSLKD